MLKKERLEIIRKYYPNAITLIDSVNRAIDYYEEVLQLEPSKIMFADSICRIVSDNLTNRACNGTNVD